MKKVKIPPELTTHLSNVMRIDLPQGVISGTVVMEALRTKYPGDDIHFLKYFADVLKKGNDLQQWEQINTILQVHIVAFCLVHLLRK